MDLDADADLENADFGDFGDLDPDDADLEAALAEENLAEADISDVAEEADLAVDDIGDVAEESLADIDGPDLADVPDESDEAEPGQPSAVAGAEAGGAPRAPPWWSRSRRTAPARMEIFVFGDDDDDLPAARVAVAGATADPVKDYLKQIGKVALLNAEQEVELAKCIEAGLFAEEKLAERDAG